MNISNSWGRWFLLALCTINIAFAHADTVNRQSFEHYLREMANNSSSTIGAELSDSMLELYQAMDYQLIWDDPEMLSQLQDSIEDSYHDGLNPADYPLPAPVAEGYASPEQFARDINTTQTLFTLLNHLYYGKVDPTSLNADWNIVDLRKLNEDRNSIVAAIRNKAIAELVQTARPQQEIYEDLKTGLLEYRAIEAAGGWLPIDAQELLRPGQHSAEVALVRRRLAISGDYAPSGTEGDETLMDPELVAAVKRFQRRHMLPADGIVGPATLAAMNQPVTQKIDQLRVNLERMRWFLKGLGDDFLLVDIAGYVLHMVSDDEFTWSSSIQVGKPYRQTPVLTSRIRYLEWNPTWTVPPTILNEDVLPAIQRDIGYLQKKNMDVLTYQNEWVDPQSIDWQRYPKSTFPYKIRQQPGPWNALGTVKFIFPNEHLVYLHDTPSKNLFSRSNRAFSSGCIRVAKPYELAKLLLDISGPGADQQIQDRLSSGKTRRQYLDQAFPVVLLYWTTKELEDGSLVFAPDIYDRDTRLLQALNRPLPTAVALQ
jgi:murein L,D-transpeptidase YcbB/YkuD